MTVQLIKAATDAHLWAETFDRKLTDIFAVESEIARNIADKLRAELTGSEVTGTAPRDRPENPRGLSALSEREIFLEQTNGKRFPHRAQLFPAGDR